MPDGSVKEIEAQVHADRASLARSLDRLSEAADADAFQAEAGDLIDRYGQQALEFGRTNPAAVALIAVGAGMLFSGLGGRPQRPVAPPPDPAMVPPEKAMHGFDARVAGADAEIRSNASGTSDLTAVRMRVALKQGLDKLPEPAKRRIIDMRLRAIAAQERIEVEAQKAQAKVTRTVARRPIESAALALGLGAVMAALIPPTRVEDRHLGAERDRAISAAADALRGETERLTAKLKTPGTDARHPSRAAKA